MTHLYLQHNTITKIENLESLENLQKLYLGHNNIIVVEGLENTKKLQELYIESQKIPLGESLCFEPRSAFILSVRVPFEPQRLSLCRLIIEICLL